MGVQKIIQANSEVFNVDKNKNRSEKEAIRIVAAMECEGNKIQIENFEIRQSYIAVCNLLSLGFRESSINLAIDLIARAEWFQQYRIAQDLCDKLITHYYLFGSLESVKKYKGLHDKYTLILSCEHESKLLYGEAVYNYQHLMPIDIEKIMKLLETIKQKLPVDSLWYHYYYYQCKTLMYSGAELEELYFEAIQYFENLYFNHTIFISMFKDELIKHYISSEYYEKALSLVQQETEKYEPGTIRWFRNSLSCVRVLLKMHNPKSKEICNMVMSNSKYSELPDDVKTEWDVANMASINITKNSN